MKIDSMLTSFFEQYDDSAIESINNLSNNIAYSHNKNKIKGYNFKESFQKFNEYIVGYSQYLKEESENNKELKSIEFMKEAFNKFMDKEIFNESEILLIDIPNEVCSYLEGVKSTIDAYNEAHSNINESGLSSEYHELLNEMTDEFANKLEVSFNPFMESSLRISGYTTTKNLFETPKKYETSVFL